MIDKKSRLTFCWSYAKNKAKVIYYNIYIYEDIYIYILYVYAYMYIYIYNRDIYIMYKIHE